MRRATLPENNVIATVSAAVAVVALLFVAGDWSRTDGWLSIGAVASLALAVCFTALAGRAAMLGVEVRTDSFEIRNLFRTHRLARQEVVGFELGRSTLLRNDVVLAVLHDGIRVRVNGLGPSPLGLFHQKERLVRELELLNERSLGGRRGSA